ncbi:MAG: hypothetical protein KF903_10085 [Dokdonella sp.]|uniref:hypothetical protein n=1 Tax=Dokdonella sp. TaxID=2291710 RepID=UPI0025BAD8A5|nr:hypothetical protein [Dokdonella sp.]MBX3701334.1 hypothetical protein [Dokdonella sp.]
MSHFIRTVACLVLCMALGACVETRFEAPLGDNIETCDTGWKGLWFEQPGAKASNDDNKERVGFFVDEACALTLFEQGAGGAPLKRWRVAVNFVHLRGGDYLVVADSALRSLGEIAPPHAIEPPPAKSYYYVRYRLRGDRLELYEVDSAKAARLVIDGKLEGTVNKTRNELHVYLRGGRAQMLDIVRKHDLFSDKPWHVFRRSGQDLQDFERSLQHTATEPRR